MKIKLLLTALLLLALLLASVSCQNGKRDQTPDSSHRVVLSATDCGIVSDGWIAETALPQNTEILEWYEESKAREIIPYALLYSKDASDGLWHCWLYVGTWQADDVLTLGKLDTEGFCVTMSYETKRDDPETGAAGAIHFSFSYEGEPSFEFSVNGDSDGMISTISDVSVAP